MLLSLGAFAIAATLIVLLPGPDTLVVLRNLVRSGRSGAVRTVLGVLTGLTVWVITAALGLSAVLRASHEAYLALRVAGALYLLWLGVQSLRTRSAALDALDAPSRRSLVGTGYPAGLATNLLNPKVGVFFVTFLPGFVPAGFPVGWVSLLLGAVFVVLTVGYFALLIAASGPITRLLTTGRVRRRIERVTGLVLIGFGLRLGLES
jgi:threonine/homoserine/homoserine lactone efflux protein